jgi:hypothetical protein
LAFEFERQPSADARHIREVFIENTRSAFVKMLRLAEWRNMLMETVTTMEDPQINAPHYRKLYESNCPGRRVG